VAGNKALVMVAVDKKGIEAMQTLVEGLECDKLHQRHESLRLKHAPGILIILDVPVSSSAHRSRRCAS